MKKKNNMVDTTKTKMVMNDAFKKQVIANITQALICVLILGAYFIVPAFAASTKPTGDFTGDITSVTINTKADVKTLTSRIVALICYIISAGGVVTLAQGYGTYSSGHSEDNSATESKGVRKMIAGVIQIGAPLVAKWLFA